MRNTVQLATVAAAILLAVSLNTPAAQPPIDRAAPVSVGASVGGRVSPAGVEIQCDLPGELQQKNIASSGLGCCVFRSIDHAARWQNVPALIHFPEWMVEKHIPGGGYPQKVEDLIPKIAKDRNAETPDYIQVEGTDLEILKLACRTGRMPGVTYSFSPTGRYGGQRIAHMVNIAHADDQFFAVLDNNYIGEDNYEWLTPAEFTRTYAAGGQGWSVILLAPSPPPVPTN